jgi:hypothetical protein
MENVLFTLYRLSRETFQRALLNSLPLLRVSLVFNHTLQHSQDSTSIVLNQLNNSAILLDEDSFYFLNVLKRNQET